MKKRDWIFTACVWIGQIIIIRERNWIAFLFYAVANAYYSFKWLKQKEYAALGATMTAFVINIYGLAYWI